MIMKNISCYPTRSPNIHRHLSGIYHLSNLIGTTQFSVASIFSYSFPNLTLCEPGAPEWVLAVDMMHGRGPNNTMRPPFTAEED